MHCSMVRAVTKFSLEPRNDRAADDVRMKAYRRHRVLPELALADDEVAMALFRARDEPRNLSGIMLMVGVQKQHVRAVLLQHVLQARPDRAPFAPVLFVPDDDRAGVARSG